MNKLTRVIAIALCIAGFGAYAGDLDTVKIEELSGLKGVLNAQEGVFKVSKPREDIQVSIDGWRMPPFMGLTSWVGFNAGKEKPAMVMGDLVLFQDEVNPVMSAALENGLAVTALHNHFFYDEPKVYFMHIGGEGTIEQLAKGVRAAFDKVKEIRAANPQPGKTFGQPFAPSANSISGDKVESIMGSKGQAKDGMFKVVIGRKAKMECGCEVGKEMGVNTWAAFAGTDDNAIVDGDFVMLESELQPVLTSLRKDGINIVAIHHHMVGEQPRYLFLHYWGKGAAPQLAQAVKNALDKQKQPQTTSVP